MTITFVHSRLDSLVLDGSLRRHAVGRDLDDGTREVMTRPDNVVERSEEDDEAGHQAAVIHRLGFHSLDRRPEAEEEDDHAEEDAESVVDDTEDSWNAITSPDQGAGFTAIGG